MKTITDLKPQIKNGKRVSVYLNGSYYCGLDIITVMKNRIKVGDEIEESKLVEIQREAEAGACFESALKYISKSVKTEKQVKIKLLEKGYLEEIVLETLEKLKDYKFIDDKDYSERYVSTYKNNKGKKLIELELKNKGISKNDIYESLELVENELETAIKIAEKYVKNKEKDAQTLQKCYKYLISKGFNYEDSLTASKKAINSDEKF
ncbi:MAG: RecX family transcriptional regulator [Clostridia bacterium]|nr:RecX family transcriptional regulator [Clostridia bacterium]